MATSWVLAVAEGPCAGRGDARRCSTTVEMRGSSFGRESRRGGVALGVGVEGAARGGAEGTIRAGEAASGEGCKVPGPAIPRVGLEGAPGLGPEIGWSTHTEGGGQC